MRALIMELINKKTIEKRGNIKRVVGWASWLSPHGLE